MYTCKGDLLRITARNALIDEVGLQPGTILGIGTETVECYLKGTARKVCFGQLRVIFSIFYPIIALYGTKS